MHFRSIIAQIAALHILAIAAACIALPISLYFLLQSAVEDLQRQALSDQAKEIASHLSYTDAGWRLSLTPELKDAFTETYGRYAYAVVSGDGAVLFSSFTDGSSLSADDPHDAKPHYFTRRRGTAELAGVSTPFRVSGATVWVQAAENFSHRDVLVDDVVRQFFPRVAWITAPILLALLVIEIFIVRVGLRPIRIASERASRIGPSATDVRLPEAGIPGEIVPLVHAVNAALERLEKSFKFQREFTANAAHELRTPLAILRTNIELIGDKQIGASLLQDIDMISRLVEQLLNTAEVDSLEIGRGQRCDLHRVCVDVATYMAPLAVKQEKSLAVTGEAGPVWIAGDADFLRRAVRNLVENAIAHTPRGSTVEINVTAEPAVHVMDEGPGIPLAERDLVFQRFWRRDRRGRDGFGLGLSIVARIAAAHRGRVSVGERPSGGAVFSISFGES